MAFKKEQRTTFNPATIQVNRGQGARQLASAIGEQGSTYSAGVNNFIKNRLAEMEEKEKKLGEKLGKQLEIVYQDKTYTDSEGNTRTHKVATNYKTPENLLTTSWSTVTFDDQAADTYAKAIVQNANQILDDEKLILKQKSRLDQTVAEHIAVYDKNIQPAIDALLSTVDPQMRGIVEADIRENARVRRTDLANSHLKRVKNYRSSQSQFIQSNWKDIAPGLLISNLDEYKKQLAIVTKSMRENAFQDDDIARFWIENELNSYQLLADTGKTLQSYLQHDPTSQSSMARVGQNITTLRMLINNPGQQITLIDQDGNKKNFTGKDLGFGSVDGITGTKLDGFLREHNTFLSNMYDQSGTAQRNMEIISLNEATGQPQNLTKKEYENYSQAISNWDSAESEKLIAAYAAHGQKINRAEITAEYLQNNLEEQSNYWQWVANTQGVLPVGMSKLITEGMSDIMSDNGESDKVLDMVSSPAFTMVANSIIKTKEGNYKTRNIIDYLPIGEKEKEEFYILQGYINSNSKDLNKGVDLYVANKRKRDDKNGYTYANYTEVNSAYKNKNGATALDLKDQIVQHVQEEWSDIIGYTDVALSTTFQNKIMNTVIDKMRTHSYNVGTSGDVENMVLKAGYDLLYNGNFGESKYMTSISHDFSRDAGKIELGKTPVMVQWSIDDLFEMSATRQKHQNYLKAIGLPPQGPIVRDIVNDSIKNQTKNLKRKNPKFQINDEIKLGENAFFICVNKSDIVRKEQAIYKLVHYTNDDPAFIDPQDVINDDGFQISYSYNDFVRMGETKGAFFGTDLKLQKISDQFSRLREGSQERVKEFQEQQGN